MGDVVDLFTGKQVPAADDSDFVQDFIDGPLADLVSSLDELDRVTDETEFRKWMDNIRYQVSKWPK